MDIVALATQLDCVFIAKSEVGNWAVIGFLCRSIKTIFINRNVRRDIQRALGSIASVIKEGYGVVLFAEGTSTRGETVAPFKPSLLELAAQARLPVHYASISYVAPLDSPPAHTSICWWGDMTFPKHLFELFQMRGFEVELNFGTKPIQATDRKTLAADLWSAVHKQFRPVVVIE
jgi:1-acyl-sn-glycerol-3-phosphate acyltransferase